MFKILVVTLISLEYVASTFVSNETISSRHPRQIPSCGVPYKKGTGLIIGGKNLERGSWPWMVALLEKPSENFFCGATLISSTKVVSAAHCVLEKFATEAKIARDVLQVFGAHNLSNIHQSGTFSQSPWKIIIHNDWNPEVINFDADIALLLNEEEIPTTRLIKPICLWTFTSTPVANEGTLAGWGLASNNADRHSPIPKQIKVPIHQNDDCLYDNPLLARLKTKRTLCAGARDGTGPCLGDSGSGMVIEQNGVFYLRAIVASAILNSNQTCDLSNYAVYTDVLKYLIWINEIESSNFLVQESAYTSKVQPQSTQAPPNGTNSNVFVPRPTKAAKRPRPTAKTTTVIVNPDVPTFKKTLAYDRELSDSMEAFALRLMHTANDLFEDANFMISPFSVYHSLVLIAEGAKGNTLKELSDQLKMITLERTRDFQQYLFVVINRNIADVILKKFAMMVTDRARPVNPEFETRIETIYEADVMPVYFSDVDNTLNSINRAVSNYTQGQITDTVKREDLFKAQLILISGLFFQGKWMNVFNNSFTKQESFFDSNGVKTGEVNMMFQRGFFKNADVHDLGGQIIELPYDKLPASNDGVTGTGLSMILVLARKGLLLDEVIANIYKYGMKKIYDELGNSRVENEDVEVELHVPRFEIETSFNMKHILESMGVKDMFDQSRADLSNINRQYFVSSIFHKTKMSVDEMGGSLVAGSVTNSIYAKKATSPAQFHANKPFLFFIVDRVHNLILFSGQYVKPELY